MKHLSLMHSITLVVALASAVPVIGVDNQPDMQQPIKKMGLKDKALKVIKTAFKKIGVSNAQAAAALGFVVAGVAAVLVGSRVLSKRDYQGKCTAYKNLLLHNHSISTYWLNGTEISPNKITKLTLEELKMVSFKIYHPNSTFTIWDSADSFIAAHSDILRKP